MRAPAMNIQNWKSPTTERTLTSESLQLRPSKEKRPPHKRRSKPRGCGQVRPRASSQATGDDRLVLPSSCFVQTAFDLQVASGFGELLGLQVFLLLRPLLLLRLGMHREVKLHLELRIPRTAVRRSGSSPRRQWAARPPAAALGRSSQSRSRQVRTWKIRTNRAKSEQVTSHNVDSLSRIAF